MILTSRAWCTDPTAACGWQVEGEPAAVDYQAEIHTHRTGHATVTHSTPIETDEQTTPIERTK